MVQKGDLVPHFAVQDLRGETVSYATIWQRKNLVLLCLPCADSESSRNYASQLAAQKAEFTRHDTELIITRDTVRDISGPAVLVTDRWGEVIYIASESAIADLPPPSELLEWVHYVQSRCPECEGEAR